MSRIILIGPVYPYKSGISHYTSLMYKALSRVHDVSVISYKMQYPKLLFKGEQKDYDNDLFKTDNTNFLINTANPFNIYNVGKYIKKENPDVVIIQWWHPYFAPCYRILEAAIGKNIKKLFICHNVFPHERFSLDEFLTRLVLKNGDYFVVHSKSDGEDLLSIKKDAVFSLNPHPTYNAFKIRDISCAEARDTLNIQSDAKVLLFFGFVREYKGLKHLLNAMPDIIGEIGNIKLLIVGAFDDDKDDYLKLVESNHIGECVEIIDKYVPNDEVENYFAAADLVVCPYESATQSGIVQIAYGFEKPVVATNVGGLPDVVKNDKTGYVVEPKNAKAIAGAVINYYKNDRKDEFVRNIKDSAYEFSWERMTDTIKKLIF